MKTSMARKIKSQDNASNIKNPKKEPPGTNRQYDQNQGNWSQRLNFHRSHLKKESNEVRGREIFRK